MKQYLDAVREILETGTRKENRTGIDTLSTFNINYEIDLRDGFPLLTTKKINWKNIVVENLWFLSGAADIGLLQKHGCKFWDPWADEDGMVPSAYGNFWRHFPVHELQDVKYTDYSAHQEGHAFNDQIAWVVDQLRNNPMSRRLVVSAWAPGNAQTSNLPPCHVLMVFNVQNLPVRCEHCHGVGMTEPHTSDGRPTNDSFVCSICDGAGRHNPSPHLCLHMTQRSCDIALGVPYNIAGYAFLLELFARFADMPAGIFAHTLVDAHVYTSKPDGSMAEFDHVPGLKEQLTRKPCTLPKLKIAPRIQSLSDITQVLPYETENLLQLFQLEDYNPQPAIKFKVAV